MPIKYDSITAVFDGNIVTQMKDVSVEWDAALNQVNTKEGRGYSQGTKFISASGTLVIPAAGPQINPVQKMDDFETAFVQFFVGPLECKTEATFMNASIASSTESETTFSFSMECDWAPLA